MEDDLSDYRHLIETILKNKTGGFGNEILYDMCKKHPEHTNEDVVNGKVWLIGRAYAASIERRRENAVTEINDDFYVKTVGPTLVRADFDKHLARLQKYSEVSEQNIGDILSVHKELINIFNRMTKLDKRSLASKYLHFHKPELFFIYDSRVVKAMRQFQSSVPNHLKHILDSTAIDDEYAKFCLKALTLKDKINKSFDKHINNRQFDSALIELANIVERSKYNK